MEEHDLVLICNAGLEPERNCLVHFSSGDLLVLMAGSKSHLRVEGLVDAGVNAHERLVVPVYVNVDESTLELLGLKGFCHITLVDREFLEVGLHKHASCVSCLHYLFKILWLHLVLITLRSLQSSLVSSSVCSCFRGISFLGNLDWLVVRQDNVRTSCAVGCLVMVSVFLHC